MQQVTLHACKVRHQKTSSRTGSVRAEYVHSQFWKTCQLVHHRACINITHKTCMKRSVSPTFANEVSPNFLIFANINEDSDLSTSLIFMVFITHEIGNLCTFLSLGALFTDSQKRFTSQKFSRLISSVIFFKFVINFLTMLMVIFVRLKSALKFISISGLLIYISIASKECCSPKFKRNLPIIYSKIFMG